MLHNFYTTCKKHQFWHNLIAVCYVSQVLRLVLILCVDIALEPPTPWRPAINKTSTKLTPNDQKRHETRPNGLERSASRLLREEESAVKKILLHL